MRPVGGELVARWREAGEWWSGAPYIERRRYIGSDGIMREEEKSAPPIGSEGAPAQRPYNDDHSEEWSLRIGKTRDEKVAKACGLLPPEPHTKLLPPSMPAGEERGYRVERTYRARPTIKSLRQPSTKNTPGHVPLHVLSGYAFGRGTMLAMEIPHLAAQAGIPACALTDPISLVGAVEFARTARDCGVKPLIGTTMELPEGGEVVLIAQNAQGFRNLSHLITECHLNEPRLFPLGRWERLERYREGLLCLTGGDRGPLNHLLSADRYGDADRLIQRLIGIFGGDQLFVEIERSYLPWEMKTNRLLLELAERFHLMPVAGGEVTHARRDHYPAQDILTCVETLCTVEEIIGRKITRDPSQPQVKPAPQRALNAERFLRTPREMASLFEDMPELLEHTHRIAERCDADVLPKRTRMPKLFPDSNSALCQIAHAESVDRYGVVKSPLRKRIEKELDRICRLDYADHFLIMWDACKWARSHDIQFSGRGSVVDSVVSYCLGFSRIDAFRHNLHFDRFLPEDGSKRPDIDIDFEAARREDVRQYLRGRYGDDKVATVAAIGSYRTRGIVREIGKAMELPPETVSFLCKRIHGGVPADQLEAALERRPELRNSAIPKERFKWIFKLAERLMDVPRGMRSHSSGVVISDAPIADTVPVMWSGADAVKIIQWDKRSAKHYFDKFDILCLRGQDVLSGTERMVRQIEPGFDVQRVDAEDPDNFRVMRAGHLIGIPQSASPAMRQAHQRIQTMNLDDASLVQAGIRPGVGGAVKINELILRRRGKKPYSFLHPELERILGNTYGIIVFQEQVDQLLQVFAGYTSGKAESMREAIHEKRHERFAEEIQGQVKADIQALGHGLELTEHVFELVSGFKGYGFAQGHALAFAEISLRCVWCQQHFPAEYFAALLNAQPAGYYGPNTLANEARIRGVVVLPPCVNKSEVDFTVEAVQSQSDPKLVFPNGGIRTGLKQITGVSSGLLDRVVRERWKGIYESLFDLVVRTHPARDELEKLILSGALDCFGENRRGLLWSIPKALEYSGIVNSLDVPPPETSLGEGRKHLSPTLPLELREPSVTFKGGDLTDGQKAVYERILLGMDIDRHLLAFERQRIIAKGGITSAEASRLPPGAKAFVVGNPLRLRFPPTASGKRVMFFDLEDETGLLNVTCFDETYQKYGHAVVCNSYVTLFGEAQDRDGHTAFLASRILPYRPVLESCDLGDVVTVGDFLMK